MVFCADVIELIPSAPLLRLLKVIVTVVAFASDAVFDECWSPICVMQLCWLLKRFVTIAEQVDWKWEYSLMWVWDNLEYWDDGTVRIAVSACEMFLGKGRRCYNAVSCSTRLCSFSAVMMRGIFVCTCSWTPLRHVYRQSRLETYCVRRANTIKVRFVEAPPTCLDKRNANLVIGSRSQPPPSYHSDHSIPLGA